MKQKSARWDKHIGGNWTDFADSKLAEWLQHAHIFVSSRLAGEAAQTLAHENSFHPVREYLKSLAWGGKPRLETWLHTYLGAEDNPYHRAAGKCWMISAVARMLEPGCQADYTLLLEGAQGIWKSSALRTLAGEEFFLDGLSEIDNKDALLQLHGAWIVELAELASIKRSAIEKQSSC